MTKIIEGNYSANTGKFTIVAARFNEFIVNSLLEGAIDTLKRLGVAEANITVVKVPGAFELPLTVRRIAQKRQCDAIIALGAVIRGSTPHFDHVAGQCASGIARVSLEEDMPVVFGVLTTDTIEQAIERSGTKAGNKGSDAAMAAMEMVSLFRRLE